LTTPLDGTIGAAKVVSFLYLVDTTKSKEKGPSFFKKMSIPIFLA
jgi:hypothetical protein